VAFVLSSCGNAPVSVRLDDFSIKVDALANTLGKVVYPKQAATFEKSGLHVKTVTLNGKLTYSADIGSDSLTMAFYARLSDPKDAGCSDAGLAWLCDKANETPISDPQTFQKDTPTPFSLGDKNPTILADGINQGKIWIGVEVTEESAATGVTFDFTDMVANVTLF